MQSKSPTTTSVYTDKYGIACHLSSFECLKGTVVNRRKSLEITLIVSVITLIVPNITLIVRNITLIVRNITLIVPNITLIVPNITLIVP